MKNRKGYSFIEGIFATFIVTVGMVAVVQLMSANLSLLVNSRNQTLATFLAQEGVEVARNIRDNNWASLATTFNNFPSGSASNCQVVYNSTSISCSGNDKRLRRNVQGSYSYVGSDPASMFQRELWIIYDTGDSNTASTATVTSVVVWGNNSFPADLTACNSYNHCVYTTVILNRWGGSD